MEEETKKSSFDIRLVIIKAFKDFGHSIIKFFKVYWPLLLMNAVIFTLTVFVESNYMYSIGKGLMIINTALFVIIPTILFVLFVRVDSKDIILSIPILYFFFFIFLDYCTLRDLYGITSGAFDTLPNYIDALLVVFIFTFLEYIPAYIIKLIRYHNKNK